MLTENILKYPKPKKNNLHVNVPIHLDESQLNSEPLFFNMFHVSHFINLSP